MNYSTALILFKDGEVQVLAPIRVMNIVKVKLEIKKLGKVLDLKTRQVPFQRPPTKLRKIL